MLSLLLTAAAALAHETPAALCPPCHEEVPTTALSFLMSVLKSVVSLLVIVFPLYKTFKAFESNRLRACRTMLAYWSAMTLLNALKEVTDEIVGNHLNQTVHHLLVAALKLAPLVLGPDKIYDLTVRSFFEHHEAEMDAMVLAGTEKAAELKEKMEPTLDKVKGKVEELKERIEPVIEKIEATVEPTIDQIRESLRESVDTVKTTLGMETEPEVDTSGQVTAELSAEEAVRRDEELTVVEDATSKTGLRQRSARMESSTKSPAGVTADAESEIEKAKARNVLVEKIVWGHGLSAKNDEYQRQEREKQAVQEAVVDDVHKVANQFNTVPAQSPAVVNRPVAATTAATTTTTTSTTSAPPLPPRPAQGDAITITDTKATSTSTATSTASKTSTASTTAPVLPPTPTTILDSRTANLSGKKTILLDTRTIPNVVETYATDYQKEL